MNNNDGIPLSNRTGINSFIPKDKFDLFQLKAGTVHYKRSGVKISFTKTGKFSNSIDLSFDMEIAITW